MVEKKVLNLKNKVKNLSEKTQKINDEIIKGIKYRESFFNDITKLDKNIDKIINSIADKKTKTNKINPTGKKSESINKNNVANNNPVKSNKSRKKSINKNNVANNNPVKRNKSVKKPKSVKSNVANNNVANNNVANNNRPLSVNKNNKKPEEIVIYIPADREENRGNIRGNMSRDIEELRQGKINFFLKNKENKSKLVKFNFDLKPPNKEDSIQVQENYISSIITNLREFQNTFCFFKYSGKEKETYEAYKSDANFKKKTGIRELKKLEKKYNKNRTNENKTNLEDAVYNLERIDIELEIKKKDYEAFEKNPNKLADIIFNKLINVKQEQSVNNKKLYLYEILGFDESSYKRMIDMCIDLRNSKIKDIDLKESKKKITKNDEKIFIKYNDIVNRYVKSMLDTLQNKKIVYKIKKTITNKKDKLKVPHFDYNNKSGRLKIKSS